MKKIVKSRICICASIMVISAIFISCDNDVERVSNFDVLTSDNGEMLKVRNDTIVTFPENSFTTIRDTAVNENSIEVLNRFVDVKKGDVWFKAKFGKWCIDYGLSEDLTYLIRKDYYFQLIPENKGYVAIPFVPQDSKDKMGFYENHSGTPCIGYDGGFGITPKFGSFGNCWTIIYYIGYDASGNSVGLYFPTFPEKITWYYSWYKL